MTSDNKAKTALKQGGIIAGALVGGKAAAAAGAGPSALCGPYAPVCTAACAVIGAIGGAFVTEKVMDYFDEEIEEFLQWGIY